MRPQYSVGMLFQLPDLGRLNLVGCCWDTPAAVLSAAIARLDKKQPAMDRTNALDPRRSGSVKPN